MQHMAEMVVKTLKKQAFEGPLWFIKFAIGVFLDLFNTSKANSFRKKMPNILYVLSFDEHLYICKNYHERSVKGNIPCHSV